MEAKSSTQSTAPGPRNENLTCWRTATNPQCLQVVTDLEIHLLPYGYFQHAQFSRKDNSDWLLLRFGSISVSLKGKRLDALVDAFARLGVEQIGVHPEKYITKISESIITEIQVRVSEDGNLATANPDD